jgi:chemotaxis protein methyltransferase CheR
MSRDLTAEDLARLSALLVARSGLACDEDRWPFLRNRAGEAIRRAGFTTARRWLDEVGESAIRRGALYVSFEEALTVQETAFFRYAAHHRVLRERVVPALVRTGGARVRLLTVGCATGEEPYSIAMTLHDSVPPALVPAIEIVALDVSRPALATAVAGRYPVDRLARVPPAYRDKYFLAGSDAFTVAPALRQMVRFRQHDVRRGVQIGRCAVVFCCDVLPSFTPSMRRQVLSALRDTIADGGFLFVGDAHEPSLDTREFEPVDGAEGTVFRRRTAAAPEATTNLLAGSVIGG